MLHRTTNSIGHEYYGLLNVSLIVNQIYYVLQSHDPLVNEYEGLLKVWLAMQKTVCGKKPVSKEKIEKFQETNKFGTCHIQCVINGILLVQKLPRSLDS